MWPPVAGSPRLIVGVTTDAKGTYGQPAARPALFVTLGTAPSPWNRLLIRVRPVVAGVVAGLVVAWWVVAVLQTYLFGVDGREPLYYVVVVAVLVATAALAAWLPARRAARVDPVAALRVQ